MKAPTSLCCIALHLLAFAGVLQATGDPGLIAGRPLAPMEIQWSPVVLSKPLPEWADSPVNATAGGGVFPIPPEWKAPAADRYALTVIFEDTEDTGPIVEWRSREGDVQRISEGLGESPTALGMHARTLLLPGELTASGGAVIVSMPWRPEGLISASLQPVRDVTIAVAGARHDPGLIDRAGQVEEQADLQSAVPLEETGDFRYGPIFEAELAPAIEELSDGLEFAIPIDGVVEGAVLRTEAIGLAPTAQVEVVLNGKVLGTLQAAPFSLDDPAVVVEESSRVLLAGWRKMSLFIPADHWKRGDNTLVLRPRFQSPVYRPVSLKRTFLQLRFTAMSTESRIQFTDIAPPSADEDDPWQVGPDFETPLTIVEEPPPLPAVTTSPVPVAASEITEISPEPEVEQQEVPPSLPAISFGPPKIPIEGHLPVDD